MLLLLLFLCAPSPDGVSRVKEQTRRFGIQNPLDISIFRNVTPPWQFPFVESCCWEMHLEMSGVTHQTPSGGINCNTRVTHQPLDPERFLLIHPRYSPWTSAESAQRWLRTMLDATCLSTGLSFVFFSCRLRWYDLEQSTCDPYAPK